jgi:putative transcriptional regulator
MPKKQIKQGPIRLNRIKVVLVEKNILQKDLAQRVKKDTNSISKICNNLVQPSLKLLFEISIALNVDVRTLVNPTEEVKDSLAKEKKKE